MILEQAATKSIISRILLLNDEEPQVMQCAVDWALGLDNCGSMAFDKEIRRTTLSKKQAREVKAGLRMLLKSMFCISLGDYLAQDGGVDATRMAAMLSLFGEIEA
jgi:hypothetical protein